MPLLYWLRAALLLLIIVTLPGALGFFPLQVTSAQSGDDKWATVEVAEISKSGATLSVTLSEGAEEGILYLRFRALPEGLWVGKDRISFLGGVAQTTLTGLEAGTNYEVQVSLESMFLPTDSLTETFATLPPDPYVSNVSVEDVTGSSATITVTIAHPGSDPNTVYLRYRTGDSQQWSEPLIIQATNTETVGVTITCLSPGSNNVVEASLEEGFIAEQTVSKSFRTLLPRVSEVSIESRSSYQASVMVTIEEPGHEANEVYLRYGVSNATETAWTTMAAESVIGHSVNFVLTGLVPGTSYTVQASMDSEFNSGVAGVVFSMAPLPSLGPVNLVSVAERSARIAVTILDYVGTGVRVYMRYRETPAGAWSTAVDAESTAGGVEFALSGLVPITEYEVEASLVPGFENAQARVFITEVEAPRVSSLTSGEVTRSSAELGLEIANAGGRITAFVRYRSREVSNWEPVRTVSTSSSVGRLILNNLESDTLYEAEASLDPGFPSHETLYATFWTEPGAELSAITAENVTDTTANIVVYVERIEGRIPIHLRYRVYGEGDWSGPVTRSTSNATVAFSLTELLPDSQYEIEASLDPSFTPLKTIYQHFETDRAPEISSLRLGGITDTGAKASVNISRPQPRMTVYLRYRAEMEEAWSGIISKTVSSRSASLVLERLMPETMYEVQVSLNSDFPELEAGFFTTEEMGPSVSGIKVEDITESSATINIAISDSPGSLSVFLRYRKTGASRWIKPASRTATASNISFELDSLTANTSYAIEASLEASFPTQSRIRGSFRTRSILEVSNVVLVGVTETDARISIGLSGRSGTSATTYIRYRELPDGEWQGGRLQLESDESSVLISDLLPGTEYLVEASIEEDFIEAHTESEKFKTQVYEPTTMPVVMTAEAAPRAFSFAVPENAPSQGGSRLEIWSSEPSAGMEFSIKEDLQWLIVEPETETELDTRGLLIVELRIDASGLGAGVYSGEIEIIGNADNLPLRIPVTLTIASQTPTPEPTIRPSPSPTPTSFPQSTSTPQPTIFPVATPTPSPLASPPLSPSPIPTLGGQSVPTMTPAPTVPSKALTVSEATSTPSPTPALSEVMERDKGLPALTLAFIVLAALCVLLFGCSFARRPASR